MGWCYCISEGEWAGGDVIRLYEGDTYLIDVNTSHTPEEGAHSPSWPKELIIIIIYIIKTCPLPLSVSEECDRIAQIAVGGVGLVLIRNHPRDIKYAEASTIMIIIIKTCIYKTVYKTISVAQHTAYISVGSSTDGLGEIFFVLTPHSILKLSQTASLVYVTLVRGPSYHMCALVL